MNSIDKPKDLRRSFSSSRTYFWTETSSADTGSSATISFGFTASARTMPMRWRAVAGETGHDWARVL
jgi:hypothetical protein